jgi:DNA-binding winged helix-turn-helix (wHTH) protein
VPPVLIRLFLGVIREGAHDRLFRVLHDQVLPRLEAHPGVTSTTLAIAVEGSPDEYLVESHWRGVGELIRFAGDAWRTPRVEPAEEELLVSVVAHHYVTDGWGPPSGANLRAMPAVIFLDDVEIDGPHLQVVSNGSAVHLPPREMAAMLTLASDVDAPVASAELARRIWPGSAMVTPYDVRRVVHRLRVLLRSNGTPVRIRNVHGVGYGLELDQPGEPRPRLDRRSPPTPTERASVQDTSRTSPARHRA